MKKLLLKSLALLLVAVMAISAFASCGETEKQDNDTQSEKEEVNDGEKTSDDEGTSDDNKIGTEGLAYKLLDNDTYEVSVGSAKETTEIVIPSKYNGKPVTSIAFEAFENCDSLTSIDIPDSVTNISGYAFCGCTNLVKIEVSANNSMYKSINGNLYTKDGTMLIQYAIGKEDISFEVPDGVKTIAGSAFEYCSSLTSVTIGNSVTFIGGSAFRRCTGLTSVTIGNSVTGIGEAAFESCPNLSGTIYNDAIYLGNTENQYLYLWKAVNKDITSVNIHNKTKFIGGSVFFDCTELTSITIPDSVTSISYHAFQNCTGLTSVTIGNSVTSIGRWAFNGCTNLTSIIIPNSVTSIYYEAFGCCTGLASIKYCGTEEQWNAIEKGEDWNLSVPESCQIIFNYTGE